MLRILVCFPGSADDADLVSALVGRGHVVSVLGSCDARASTARIRDNDVVVVKAPADWSICPELLAALEQTDRPLIALDNRERNRLSPVRLPEWAVILPIGSGEWIEALADEIEGIAARSAVGGPGPSDSGSVPGDFTRRPVFNREAALARLLGSRQLFDELARMYCEDAPNLLEEMRQGLEIGDAARVRRSAHSVAGCSANFDGLDAVDAAAAAELAAARGDLDSVRSLLARLESEVALLRRALILELGETNVGHSDADHSRSNVGS